MKGKRSSPRRMTRLVAEAIDQEFADRGPSHPTLEKQTTATISYLEQVRSRIAVERGVPRESVTKYAIAKRLGITPNRLSLYYIHGRTMDNKLAYQVAHFLGERPLQVIAELEAERSRRNEDRSFWRRVAQSLAASVLVAVGAGISTPPSAAPSPGANVAPSVYYVKSRRRWWIPFLPPLEPGDELLT